MNFFSECATEEEAKSVYYKLALHFHPDKGGDSDLMKMLIAQYDKWKSSRLNRSNSSPSYNSSRETSFKFNTIIPFDHPIHLLIKKLNSDITTLENKIKSLLLLISVQNNRIETYILQLDSVNDLNNFITEQKEIEIQKLNEIISSHKCDTIWDLIKKCFSLKSLGNRWS